MLVESPAEYSHCQRSA